MGDPIGQVDAVDNQSVRGWAAEPGNDQPLDVSIEVYRLNDDGSVGELFLRERITADDPRPDVPAQAPQVVGVSHGFHLAISPPPGGYLTRAWAWGLPRPRLLAPGDVRFARAKVGDPPIYFWLRFQGIVSGLDRPDDYESYPVAMRDGDLIRMWFAGGPADKIYYAESRSPLGGFRVWGPWSPVIAESPPGQLDSGLVADPSVIKIASPGSPVRDLFYMCYTGIPDPDPPGFQGVPRRNAIFAAISKDGANWVKMNARNRNFGSADPVILPAKGETKGYGAGQSSLIWSEKGIGDLPRGIIQYFTDTSLNGICVAVSRDGGWTFDRLENPLRGLGEFTWDMKWLPDRGVVSFAALPGPIGDDHRKHGHIAIALAPDGRHFSPITRVPLQWLTTDTDRHCINNGGLLGTPEGHITGRDTVFYFGSGYLMHRDVPLYPNRWPPLDWDIAAVTVAIE